MDNHPIPQDVTGFKFKIIGSITIKQFGYLLAAGIFALIVWLLPIVIFVKIPIILMLASIALVLAFVPIEGRPADKMIVSFVKALPSENQYVYRKRGVVLEEYEIFKPIQVEKKSTASSEADVKKKALASALRNSYFRPDKQEMEFFQNVKDAFENTNTMPVSLANVQEVARPVNTPVITADKTPVSFVKPVALPQEEINASQLTSPAAPSQNTTPAAENAQQAPITQPSTTPSATTPPPPSVKGGFSMLPDIGNVIMGRVSDPRGKALGNILVEVLDGTNTAVRALKTNISGQFAAATPLPNGDYKISFTDPQKTHEFETIPVSLSGQIFDPLEVSSVDQREKLRRELFGGMS